jgi:hypothetical protein
MLYPPERNLSIASHSAVFNIAMHALQPSQPPADGRHTKGSRTLARTTITPSHGVRSGEVAVVGCCCFDCSWCSAIAQAQTKAARATPTAPWLINSEHKHSKQFCLNMWLRVSNYPGPPSVKLICNDAKCSRLVVPTGEEYVQSYPQCKVHKCNACIIDLTLMTGITMEHVISKATL